MPDSCHVGFELDELFTLLAFFAPEIESHDLILPYAYDTLEGKDVGGHILHLLIDFVRETIEVIEIGVSIFEECYELLALGCYLLLQVSVVILEDMPQEESLEDV